MSNLVKYEEKKIELLTYAYMTIYGDDMQVNIWNVKT